MVSPKDKDKAKAKLTNKEMLWLATARRLTRRQFVDQFTTQPLALVILVTTTHSFSTNTLTSLDSYYANLVQACIRSKSLPQAKKIHQHLLKNTTRLKDTSFLLEKVAHLYITCNQVDLASRVFDEIPQPSVILWNLLIRAYAWNGPFERAIHLYYDLLQSGVKPTKYTYPFVLKACSGLQALEAVRDLAGAQTVFRGMLYKDVVAWNAMIAGFSLHGLYDDTIQMLVQMQKAGTSPNASTIVAVLPTVAQANELSQGKAMHGFSLRRSLGGEVVLGTGLLDMYSKCQCIAYARRIFDAIDVKNEVCWSAMIGAYVICDSMREAMALFDEMVLRKEINPTPVTLGSILRACTKLTDLSRGNSAIISGCVQNGYAKEALLIFHHMQLSGFDPDLATMVGVLPACSHLAALQHGACGHAYSIVHGFGTDTSICNVLIDMYSKCGKINRGRQVFDRMITRDIISWNAMIVGYGIHGLGMAAISQFHHMLAAGIKPDDPFGACHEGKHWFSAMSEDFNITSRMEHYICMVDLLGRAGLLAEAHVFIQKMPFEADVRSTIILNLGKKYPRKFRERTRSAVGRWDDAAYVRIKQKGQGLKKSPGCSWVEINGIIHGFVGGDQSHPQSAQIHEKLEELLVDMKRLGYCAENSFVLQDVEEEEKERILLYHSEKLAIAYAILSLRPGKPILVTKNLRIRNLLAFESSALGCGRHLDSFPFKNGGQTFWKIQ
ncbi:pentatricopeptide repeat-containing protein [Prunus dulcis]|uniref:Pentatricopeptide repeat-containing protein n=1 Tax=Prunus dulcis TaxID=3755 RepID=A0A4Y1RIU1_PRUDU|nr:pentatricopeptide repeat-containing protein [Prunus dulcis]